MRLNSLGVAATLLVLSLTASVQPVTAKSSTAADATALETQIRKELLMLPYYGVFDNLAFSVNGETVTLFGHVTRAAIRKDAERRVSKVEGVERVINRIEVLPPSPRDDEIRLAAHRAVFGTGGFYRYGLGVNPGIHIIVNRSRITLEGVVANKGDRQLAFLAAKGVSGAFSVTNNLRIAGE